MDERWNEIKSIWSKNRLLLPLLIGVLLFFAGFIVGTGSYTSQPNWLTGFAENFWTEAIGILLTVLVIDRIYAANNLHERKRRLFNQLKSRANPVAVDAIEQIIRENWLEEALAYFFEPSSQQSDLRNLQLHNAYLRGLRLENVDLRASDLRSADLLDVKLIGCDLAFCNLDGVFWGSLDLRGSDLYQIKGKTKVAHKSKFIILPDGTHWQSTEDWARFVIPEHELYQVTRNKINEIRDGLGLPPLNE